MLKHFDDLQQITCSGNICKIAKEGERFQMTGTLEIRHLATAERDLDDIFEYVMKGNPVMASSLLEEIDRSISHPS